MDHDKLGNLAGIGLDSGILAGTKWTDISGSVARSKLGILDKPDFDYVNLGLLFPQNDPSEKIYDLVQMRHEKKFGTSILYHVHFIQKDSNLPIFKIDYRFYNNGSAPPGFTTVDTSLSSPVYTYPGSGDLLQVIGFPLIAAPAQENLSAVVDIIFYRDDDIVSGDILVKFLDPHYQKDTAGSRLEYIKF